MSWTCGNNGRWKVCKKNKYPESGGKRGRVRRRMRWEDCVKRDIESVGGEWRTTAKYRRSWRLVIENAVREK